MGNDICTVLLVVVEHQSFRASEWQMMGRPCMFQVRMHADGGLLAMRLN